MFERDSYQGIWQNVSGAKNSRTRFFSNQAAKSHADYSLPFSSGKKRSSSAIKIITNTLYLAKTADKQILELAERIFNFIIYLDEMIQSCLSIR